jgi:hypothetical protein
MWWWGRLGCSAYCLLQPPAASEHLLWALLAWLAWPQPCWRRCWWWWWWCCVQRVALLCRGWRHSCWQVLLLCWAQGLPHWQKHLWQKQRMQQALVCTCCCVELSQMLLPC